MANVNAKNFKFFINRHHKVLEDLFPGIEIDYENCIVTIPAECEVKSGYLKSGGLSFKESTDNKLIFVIKS